MTLPLSLPFYHEVNAGQISFFKLNLLGHVFMKNTEYLFIVLYPECISIREKKICEKRVE